MPQLPFLFAHRPEAEPKAPRRRDHAAAPSKDDAMRQAHGSAQVTPDAPGAAAVPASASTQPAAPEQATVYTVSGLQRLLRGQLEERFPTVLVAGEISNFQINTRSGHAYFTLKDEGAQIKCVMWRDQVMRLRHRLEDGLQVVARARVTIYEQGGQLQLSVQSVDPQGVGARQLEYRERVERLRKEGLTSAARKRPIPPFPRCIGVVTSRSGAALRDVLRTILRRDPHAHVVLANTPVQGDGACAGIVQALGALDALGRCDVILLVRGGGSIEDLWSFNEEPVARQIVACRVPVVTGVGHETDTTLADLVADLRASTPTAAAEHVVPVRSEVRARFRQVEDKLHRALLHRVQAQARRLLTLSGRLRDPSTLLARRAQRIDDLTSRAERAARAKLDRQHEALLRLERRLTRLDPQARIKNASRRLHLLEARAHPAIAKRLTAHRHALAVEVHRLESLSPLAVLSRGYALARTAEGTVVKAARQVRPGDALEVKLASGTLGVTVDRILADGPEAGLADQAGLGAGGGGR